MHSHPRARERERDTKAGLDRTIGTSPNVALPGLARVASHKGSRVSFFLARWKMWTEEKDGIRNSLSLAQRKNSVGNNNNVKKDVAPASPS